MATQPPPTHAVSSPTQPAPAVPAASIAQPSFPFTAAAKPPTPIAAPALAAAASSECILPLDGSIEQPCAILSGSDQAPPRFAVLCRTGAWWDHGEFH